MYYNIANNEPTYPDYLSKEAKQLLRGLLEKEPDQRLGAKEGIKEIKNSKFFKNMNWEVLLKREADVAPIPVNLKSTNFD